jgi:anaerobic selenocysteine-containing dehydrogenase
LSDWDLPTRDRGERGADPLQGSGPGSGAGRRGPLGGLAARLARGVVERAAQGLRGRLGGDGNGSAYGNLHGAGPHLEPAPPAPRAPESPPEPAPRPHARPTPVSPLPTLAHAGLLPDRSAVPAFLLPPQLHGTALPGRLSCGYCGVGDSGAVRDSAAASPVSLGRVGRRSPTKGCTKLQIATGHRGTLFPIHTQPSVLDRYATQRRPITYTQGISRLADLILDHREPGTQILVYGCGQIDYFTIFAMQEVFRLLGVRNIAGNAEHCLNAGAVHNEMLTGQEGPFLTFDSALDGPGRFFLCNGWNGLVTHPGAWHRMMARPDWDGFLVDVMETESARAVARRLGPERVLLVRTGSDPQLALAVAHEILARHPAAVEHRFVERFSDRASFASFAALAREPRFEPQSTAERIAPEPGLAPRLLAGIRHIAARLADPATVPINIPSVGLSQTKGAVSHCCWGDALALVGKYGLKADGSAAGGTLRVPGQINAQSEVQALSRLFFFGRIPVTDAGSREAARRMGLPDDAYELAVRDEPRPVLDYADDAHEFDRELLIAFGTQFEANMMDRERWVAKLRRPNVTVVAVDPIPDPWTLAHAHLVIPSPPHSAAPKLYQNGEWRLTLSSPSKVAPPETRSDATILYDAMAEISRRIRTDSMLRMVHPDLGFHSQSGYLRERYEDPENGGGLRRDDGEVNRAQLWDRVQAYMEDAPGRGGDLYCRPLHADGRPIAWEELLEHGNLVYGGVGATRYRLDYETPGHAPFRDIFGKPGRFRFFVPTEADLVLPQGLILNSGRSSLSDHPARIRWAVDSFNSGKATPPDDMPEEHPLFVAATVAARLGIGAGDLVRIRNPETGRMLTLRALPTDRLPGELLYLPFHKDRAQVQRGRYQNTVTSARGRCPYTAQTAFKATVVDLERLDGNG